MRLKSKQEESEYFQKESQLKIEKLNGYLLEKTKEYEKIVKEYDHNKKLLRECQS